MAEFPLDPMLSKMILASEQYKVRPAKPAGQAMRAEALSSLPEVSVP